MSEAQTWNIPADLEARVRAKSQLLGTGITPAIVEPQGYGIEALNEWLANTSVTDLVCRGSRTRVRTDDGLWSTVKPLAMTDDDLAELIGNLARSVGDLRDAPSGEWDVALPQGRMWASIGWGRTPCLAIRSHRPAGKLSLGELGRTGMFPTSFAHWISTAARNRVNLIVAGPQGSGKTTFLRSLLRELDDDTEQITTIEDLYELNLDDEKDCVISLLTRPANVEGAGELTMADLAKGALRTSATRIVVGEVRGAEAASMLEAATMGSGFAGTIHGDGALHALNRLVQLVQKAGNSNAEVIAAQAADALHLVVYLERPAGTARPQVVEVIEVVSAEAGRFQVSTLWELNSMAMLTRTDVGSSEWLRARVGE